MGKLRHSSRNLNACSFTLFLLNRLKSRAVGAAEKAAEYCGIRAELCGIRGIPRGIPRNLRKLRGMFGNMSYYTGIAIPCAGNFAYAEVSTFLPLTFLQFPHFPQNSADSAEFRGFRAEFRSCQREGVLKHTPGAKSASLPSQTGGYGISSPPDRGPQRK